MAIAAFISYTSIKDFYGHITSFHEALEFELKNISYNDPSVYFDKKNIRIGDRWPDNLINGLMEAKVLLVMLNPRWLQSIECRKEYLKFKEFHGSDAKIIPVIWAETNVDEAPAEAKQILAELMGYQYKKDWRKFVSRKNYANNPKLLQHMSEIAHVIRDALG